MVYYINCYKKNNLNCKLQNINFENTLFGS
jgi:hypothetical protein